MAELPTLSSDVTGTRYTLAAKDPVFWRALANIVLFVLLVVPLQCGLALAAALFSCEASQGTASA